MPLNICRCCGGRMTDHSDSQSVNPNICPNCERLLEDESPILLAEIGSIEPGPAPEPLTDQPLPQKPETAPVPPKEKTAGSDRK